ncbi:MAG: photosystem II assembly protein Psb35 [Microcoleaceae cyanobacterium]
MENNLWIPAAVLVVGFIAAVTIGSIAWYSAKRPPGWEGSERPKFVPKIGDEEENNS